MGKMQGKGVMRRTKKIVMLVACGCLAALCLLSLRSPRSQAQAQADTPLSQLSKWQSRDYAGIQYVGSRACAACHAGKATTQAATPMAHALEPADDVKVLRSNPRLTFRNGAYRYEILHQNNQATYTVSDGVTTI